MYRHSLTIALGTLGLASVLTYACGIPDEGIPAKSAAAIPVASAPVAVAPVAVAPVIDRREPPPIVIEEPVLPEPNLRATLGSFKMTYYWVAQEAQDSRGTVAIVDKTCKRIARVTKSFRRRLRMEGSGKLNDGRMITKAGGCECEGVCFWVAGEDHRWGSGVANRPLKPFRSVAVDPKQVKIGSSLYVAELDGLTMPGAGDEGNFVHDGCVVADDRGGGVRGKQIDFFAAYRHNYDNFFSRHKITRVSVYKGGDRCSAKKRAKAITLAANSGAI
jgi:3D (Asp-Asp-Asp) domain-containing protein